MYIIREMEEKRRIQKIGKSNAEQDPNMPTNLIYYRPL